MIYRTLISAEDLNAHRAQSNWRVVDCRFELSRPDAGEVAWRESHIPGSVYAHLERDLSGRIDPATGRHPLPDPELLAKKLGEWGIDGETQVVAYDASGGALAAARLWWLLRWLGHERVAVLDGGWQAWLAGGFDIDDAIPATQPVKFPRRPALVEALGVRAINDNAGLQLIDARGAQRFRGEVEPIDPVAGHIPGAVNHPFSENLDANGKFLAPEMLRERFRHVVAENAVHYCGSGVTSCHNLLAMEHAGLSGSRLYAGSWSEWIRDPARPVAKGD
ncbi:MAG TPA: sulfurtransferase [Gammaproteobacteria bacterium]